MDNITQTQPAPALTRRKEKFYLIDTETGLAVYGFNPRNGEEFVHPLFAPLLNIFRRSAANFYYGGQHA